MRVVTILGTRPEIIRLSRVIAALDHHLDHILVHTGQSYDHELSQVFFDDLNLRLPDRYLEAAGATAAETIGNVIGRADAALRELKPDAVLILGDTNSSLAAIAAKRLRVPVFHMEAGNRCFDERVPEEINRRIVDHIADINLPYSDISRQYLLAEGLPADRIIKTGSPMLEVLHHYRPQIDESTILRELGLEAGAFYLVSSHREENVDDAVQFSRLIETLRGLAENGMPVVFSAHPRTRARLEESGVTLPGSVRLMKPFPLSDYVHLELHARAVLSDSGTINEEASILNLRALNIRQTHERPEAMEEASTVLTGLAWPRVSEGLRLLESQPMGQNRLLRMVPDYSVPNVSVKVLRIIVGYTDYVRRTVWGMQ